MVAKHAGNPGKAALVWGFGFRNKSLENIESVRVEEVSPARVAFVRVFDESPKLVERGREPRVLYQPTMFSPQAKQAFQRMIDKINEG
jgi:hypothetical protein